MARFIESLDGRRFTGRDLGISVEDLEIMRTETKWVAAVIQWWFRQTAYPFMDKRDGREVIANIYPVVKEILRLSREKQRPPARVADQYAESKLKPEKTYRDMNWGM